VEKDRFGSKLTAYRDGELDGGLREEVSAHLRNCTTCREELAEFEAVDSLVRMMPKIDATESFALEIIAGLSRQKRNRPLERFLRLAGSFFELAAGHKDEGDALDEFSDFPPLSMSYAYFRVIGQLR